MTRVPGYWMNETSGVLAPVIEAYLNGERLTPGQVGLMRQYLQIWMEADWRGPDIAELRRSVSLIETHEDVQVWLVQAGLANIDPL